MNISEHPLYPNWHGMRQRCNNPKNPEYKNYGGRGISVCSQWNDFWQFASDMGPKPGPDYTLDRINNGGDYEPSNCRWATMKEQSRNRRDNVLITYEGKTQCLQAWADELGIGEKTLSYRLYELNWPVERAFTKQLFLGPKPKVSNIALLITEEFTHWRQPIAVKAAYLGYTPAGYCKAVKRMERARKGKAKVEIAPLEGGLL